MRCSGCGKDIPFSGSVCPYCQRDKAKDQAYTMWAFILGLGLGWLGYEIFGIWGAIGGFAAGCIAAIAISGVGSSKPPQVRVVEDKSPAEAETSTEVRLKKLKDLREKGLIDDAEYEAKKKAVLDEV